MRPTSLRLSALALTSVAALASPTSAGCQASLQDDIEATEQATTAQDRAVAREIVALLGGDNGRCKDCHGITPQQVRAWGDAMKAVETACFASPNLASMARVDCLRSVPSDSASDFSPRRLGLYAAGVGAHRFKALFESAFPSATWSAEYAAFAERAAMPRAGTALTDDEFAKLKGWVLRGMPQLDEAFGEPRDAGADARDADASPPPSCTPSATSALAAHLAAMKTDGWGARLTDQATPMFGCGSSTAALDCLAHFPDATETFGALGVDQRIRRLRKQPLASRYWVRSSADGRYIGYGTSSSATIVDLTRPETSPGIRIAANYDPFFFPSNDGFSFAGAHTGDGIRACRQSLLADVATQTSPSIRLTEPKCALVGSQVYQSIGSALQGGLYFATWGSHENDDGGNVVTAPLPAEFSRRAATTFTPMVDDGQAYRAQPPITVVLAHEGDMMLSPSSLLASTRFGDGTHQLGYRVRLVMAQQSTDDGSTSLGITVPLAAEICMRGGKASFSFDERFLVTHQYVDHREPDQLDLPVGSSNIMLADLATGKSVRLTSSKANVFALYPHFRADGWLYFIVRDMDAATEYVVASDVALRWAQP